MFRAEFRLADFEGTIEGLHGFFELIFVAQNLAKLNYQKHVNFSLTKIDVKKITFCKMRATSALSGLKRVSVISNDFLPYLNASS